MRSEPFKDVKRSEPFKDVIRRHPKLKDLEGILDDLIEKRII